MNRAPLTLNPLPPRLSMDEYADFVEASLRESNPAHAARQKELEERIRTPFRIVDGKGLKQGQQSTVHGLPCDLSRRSGFA